MRIMELLSGTPGMPNQMNPMQSPTAPMSGMQGTMNPGTMNPGTMNPGTMNPGTAPGAMGAGTDPTGAAKPMQTASWLGDKIGNFMSTPHDLSGTGQNAMEKIQGGGQGPLSGAVSNAVGNMIGNNGPLSQATQNPPATK